MTAKYTKEEGRLVRNEKARRRNALKAVLKPLPQEIEEKIYSYMRNWIGGRVDVPMRWQKHECAVLIDKTICNLRKIKYDTSDWDDHTHLIDIIETTVINCCENRNFGCFKYQRILKDLLLCLTTTFTRRFQREIAKRLLPILNKGLARCSYCNRVGFERGFRPSGMRQINMLDIAYVW